MGDREIARASSSPGFTAINRLSPCHSSPSRPALTSNTQQKPEARTTSKSGQRRNPAVASYLGLGGSNEPAHLIKYAPTPSVHPTASQVTRKRRVARGGDKKVAAKTHSLIIKRASDRERSVITQPLNESLRERVPNDFDEPDEAPAPTLPPAGGALQAEIRDNIMILNDTASRRIPGSPAMICADDDDEDFVQLCLQFEPKASGAIDPICQTQASDATQLPNTQSDQDDFDDDLIDEDLMDLNADMMDMSSDAALLSDSPSRNIPSQPRQPPSRALDSDTMLDGMANRAGRASKTFVSPTTLRTRMLAATGDVARKPFVRPAFPAATRDRSPVIGLTSNTLLRTCFRVGEAISQSCQAAKTSTNILVELYARVLHSERDDLQQRFTFCDLFHAKPPYVQATYAAAIWRSVRLFEYDSARLLQQGRICRCIGSMKRNGKDWTMTVLNIWEATWDDVEWVQGIVQS